MYLRTREGLGQGPALTSSSQVVKFPSGESLSVVTGLPIGDHEDYWDPTGSGNPLLDTGATHKNKKLSASFTVRELTTSGGVSADIARIDPKLVECLQRLRDHVGKGVTISSGFRSWKRNREIYEKRNKKPTLSQHCAGRAADISIAGMNGLEIGKAAIDAYGPNIGVGLANTFAHIDVRGSAAAWNYGGVKDSWVAEIKRYQKEKGGKPSTAGATPGPAVAKSSTDLVRFTQRVLNAAESERLKEDGDLGTLTRGALARFRTRYGLGPGGALDGPTDVALVQRALEEVAQQSIFPRIGVLDARTGPEIAGFKSNHGLGSNATIDAATRRALADALVPKAVPAPSPKPGAITPPADPSAYRKFHLTTYHVVDQRDVPTGAVRVPIFDDQGRKLAEGSPAFFAQLSLEGTGRLEDGRLINVTGKKVRVLHDNYAEVLAYHRDHLRGKPPAYSGLVVENDRVVQALAFHEVPANSAASGTGVQNGIPLVPFRTLAADIGRTKKSEPSWKGKGGVVPVGTRVYIKEYKGIRLPDGTWHDGWFVVNDTGGGIFGVHFDVFVGTRALGRQVKHPEVASVWFPGIEQRIQPGYEYGLKR